MKLRWRGLLVASFLLTMLLERGWHAGGYALLVASFVLGLVFCVRNLDRPGMAIVLLGLALNALVCTVDHGMPSREMPFAGNARHHVASSNDHLLALSDTIDLRVDRWRAMVSVGDLMLVAGVLVAAGATVHNKRRPELRTNKGESANAQVQ